MNSIRAEAASRILVRTMPAWGRNREQKIKKTLASLTSKIH